MAGPLSAQGSQVLVEQTDTRSVELSGKYHQGMCATPGISVSRNSPRRSAASSREIRRPIAYTCSLLVDPPSDVIHGPCNPTAECRGNPLHWPTKSRDNAGYCCRAWLSHASTGATSLRGSPVRSGGHADTVHQGRQRTIGKQDRGGCSPWCRTARPSQQRMGTVSESRRRGTEGFLAVSKPFDSFIALEVSITDAVSRATPWVGRMWI